MVEAEQDGGMDDVRLLSLLPSLAFALAPLVGTAGETGKENRLTSARTGCGLKSDMGRDFPEPERTAPGRSAIGSADAAPTEPESSASGAGGCSGGTPGTISASACAPTSEETSVEHAESVDTGRSVMGNWKETRRVLGTGGDSRSDTPSTWDCGPTLPGGVGASGTKWVDCGGSRPMMRMVGGGPGTEDTSDEIGDWAIGFRTEVMKRERGRRADGVGVVLTGLSCEDLDRGGGAEEDTRSTFPELALSSAARRFRRRNMREKGKEMRVPNMMK